VRLGKKGAQDRIAFGESRRMARKSGVAFPNTEQNALAMKLFGTYGDQGEFVIGTGMFGQDHDPSIEDYNRPPSSQPGLWCKWEVVDGELQWDGREKFYDYIEWLEYMIEKFFKPWGIVLDGSINWQGEAHSDRGTIFCVSNKVTTQEGGAKDIPTPEVAEVKEALGSLNDVINFLDDGSDKYSDMITIRSFIEAQ